MHFRTGKETLFHLRGHTPKSVNKKMGNSVEMFDGE